MRASRATKSPALEAMERSVTRLRARWDAEHDLGDALDLLADAYLRTGVDGTIIEASELTGELLDAIPTDQLVGRGLAELVAPWDGARHEQLTSSAHHRVTSTSELSLLAGDGEIVRVSAAVVTGTTGETHWLLRPLDPVAETSVLDPGNIGIRTATVDQAPAVAYVAVADSAFTPEVISPTLVDLVGVEPDAWVGSPHAWAAAIHPDDRVRVHGDRLRAAETGLLDSVYRLHTADGGQVWVSDRAHRAVDPDRERWFGTLLAITHAHELAGVAGPLYDEATERAEAAEAVGEAKAAALELFAHDLRSPLAAAASLMDTIQAAGKAGDDAAIIGQALRDSLSTVTRMLDDVRELTQLGHTAQDPWKRIDVAETVEAVATSINDKRLFTVTESVQVKAIPALIQRAIANLVDNALKHVGPDGNVLVRVDAVQGALVTVEDDGPGIPPELREHLFEPFVRARSAVDGLGLGLSLVQRIAEMHRGRVAAENRAGGGARFELWLPQAAVEDSGDTAGG